MANENGPMGFRPANESRTNPPTRYKIESGYSEDLFIGDAVTLSSGYLIIATAGTGNPILGFIHSFEKIGYDSVGLPGYFPDDATGEWYANVWDDPDAVFIGQSDGVGTAISQAHVGNMGSLIYTHAGNTTTNLSGQEIDESTVSGAGAAGSQIILLGLVPTPNNAFGYNGEYFFKIHNHFLNQALS